MECFSIKFKKGKKGQTKKEKEDETFQTINLQYFGKRDKIWETGQATKSGQIILPTKLENVFFNNPMHIS